MFDSEDASCRIRGVSVFGHRRGRPGQPLEIVLDVTATSRTACTATDVPVTARSTVSWRTALASRFCRMEVTVQRFGRSVVSEVNMFRSNFSRPSAFLCLCPSAVFVLLFVQSAAATDMNETVLERVTNATVYVKTFRSEQSKADTQLGSGTGYFINRTGLAMTNNHVVDPTHGTPPWERRRAHMQHYQGGKLAWHVVVGSGTNSEQEYEANVLYQNEAADQAVLQVYAKDGSKYESADYLRLLPESRLDMYEPTWSIGFPGGDRQASRGDTPQAQVEKGNIIGLPRTPGGRLRMIYTDALVRPGNSGGPCVNKNGFLVGTVTLMKPPEGREDTGGARYSALVPAKITGEMVRNAFTLGKIAEGTDFTPFMESITQQSGLVNLTEFDRRDREDVLYFDNGDRYPGKIKNETIEWESELGSFAIPTKGIAYLMRNVDGFGLYLEGGNRLAGEPKLEAIQFQTGSGRTVDAALDDLSVVAFRTQGHDVKPHDGATVVFDSNAAHLIFDEVKGDATISTRLEDWKLPLSKIERIDLGDTGDQVVSLKDGSRFTGKFQPDKLEGRLAGTSTMIEFSLANVERCTIETRAAQSARLDGLSLRALLHDSPKEIRDAWTQLDTDAEAAKSYIAEIADPKTIKKYSDADQDRARLLDAMLKLRTGDYIAAMKAFRGISKSDDVNVAAYAAAHAEVLRTYKDFKFDGKPLSDPAVFAAAAKTMAHTAISEVRNFLTNAYPPKIERKGEFRTLVTALRRHETDMVAASVILGTEAEDLMARLWKTAIDAGLLELQRLATEEQTGATSDQSRGRGGGARRAGNSSIPGGDDGRKVVDVIIEYLGKQYDYGFHIADPDIDEVLRRKK